MEVTWSLFMEPASGQLVIVRSEPRIVFISDDMEGKFCVFRQYTGKFQVTAVMSYGKPSI